MRLFYLAYNSGSISETPSRKSPAWIPETSSRNFGLNLLTDTSPLSWSHYVMLVRRVKDQGARKFYESEALRRGGEWYRVDLLFFHRKLRCLVVIDLKVGKFTHADAGQMHLYLNYAKEKWTNKNENPPVKKQKH